MKTMRTFSVYESPPPQMRFIYELTRKCSFLLWAPHMRLSFHLSSMRISALSRLSMWNSWPPFTTQWEHAIRKMVETVLGAIYICRTASPDGVNKLYTHPANYGATVTELDTLAEALQIFIFTTAFRAILGPTQLPVQWVKGTQNRQEHDGNGRRGWDCSVSFVGYFTTMLASRPHSIKM
jgi:hypothetical protein